MIVTDQFLHKNSASQCRHLCFAFVHGNTVALRNRRE
jgi:hypothetical protein